LGIDKESSIIDAALELGIVQKKGSWYSYGDEQIAQGKEASAEYLRGDKKMKNKIVKEVKAKIK
jgi:recombination protein RecA